KVAAGDEVARFVALPGEADLLGARQDIVIAEARLENAQRRFERAQDLYKVQAATAQEFEDAQAEMRSAEAVLRSAEARVSTVEGEAGDTSAMRLALTSPIDAVVTGIHVAVGQRVSEGVPLISLEGVDPIWVRVPLYAGDLRGIDAAVGAQIQSVGDPPGTGGRRARRVTGPPSATPTAATVDLYFQVANQDGWLRAGERVGVVLRLKEGLSGLVVPWSAVVRDLSGGTWVYEKTGELTYTRRRVALRYVVGEEALLAEGPAAGAVVVRTGAMELFSTEFGPSK
ncbi:MAG: efflux RND transporter periplasmic adaptor subunit, partial [Gemmatimonadales bacterium]